MKNGASVRPLQTAGVLVAALVALLLTAGAASAAPATPPAPPAPPGPVGDLALTGQGGQGARTMNFDAHWNQPTDPGSGIGLHYVYDVTDAVGHPVDTGTTGSTAAGLFSADRCTQPYTIAVTALTQDPATGATLTGPEKTATLGETTCEINSSLAATQTGPGTLRVDIAREAPIDPYVAGDCVLSVDGRPAWTGTCGGSDGESATVTDLAPGSHELVLATTSPNGHQYHATTSVDVR